MKPIKPKFANLVEVKLNISDRSSEILKRYAEYTKFTESEIIERLIAEIMDDTTFVSYLMGKRNRKKIDNLIFQSNSATAQKSTTAKKYE